jgi:hypothetical protein
MPLEPSIRWLAIQRWRKELRAIGLVLALAAIAGFGVYLKMDRTVGEMEHIGTLETLHQSQGNTGSRFSVFFVHLPSNDVITVTPPEMTPFTEGARVRIFEATKESGRKSYAFMGYVDAASNPTIERDARKSGARPSL